MGQEIPNKVKVPKTQHDPDAHTQLSLVHVISSPRSRYRWFFFAVGGSLLGAGLYLFQIKNIQLRPSPSKNEYARKPSSAPQATTTKEAPALQKEIREPLSFSEFKDFGMWSRETKAQSSEAINLEWNAVSELEKKQEKPQEYRATFRKLSSDERDSLLQHLEDFANKFEELTTDPQRVELLRSYSEFLKRTPPPPRQQ